MSPLIERKKDLETCSCPRQPDEILETPRCMGDRVVGDGAQMLFVRPTEIWQICKRLVHFGDSHLCTCHDRVNYFRKFGH